MPQIKVSELKGDLLDWAVAQIEKTKNLFCFNSVDGSPRSRGNLPAYSTNWADGGPLLQKYMMELEVTFNGWGTQFSIASVMTQPGFTKIAKQGPTALIAVCRAIVAGKFGETVDIPSELLPC